jgi:hypothetical protein
MPQPSQQDPIGRGVVLGLLDLLVKDEISVEAAALTCRGLGYAYGHTQAAAEIALATAADALRERDRYRADTDVLFERYDPEFLSVSPEGLRTLADDEADAYEAYAESQIAKLAVPQPGAVAA